MTQPAPGREDRSQVPAEVAGGAGAIEDEIVRRLTLIQVEDMRAGVYLQVGNAAPLERRLVLGEVLLN